MWTMNFQKFRLVLEKVEEPEIKLPTSVGLLKKQESFRKNIYFCFIFYSNAFDCVDHHKETCMQVRKQQLELDMDQQIHSK